MTLAVLLPFFWMLSVSLKPATEPFAVPARLWPAHPTLQNFVTAFRPEFRTYFLNSTIVSLTTVAITVTLGLLAAYCLTRLQTRLLTVLMALLVGAQMGVVQIRVTPKTRNPFVISPLPISSVTRKWHFLNRALPIAVSLSEFLDSRRPATWRQQRLHDHPPPFRMLSSTTASASISTS
ncbi:MAG: carbohydrate ABC transporter permease [Acetobacteraceae bacterium]|nr:carbohydrate ABC transporter permease [Acetobacteraceae bacterium]